MPAVAPSKKAGDSGGEARAVGRGDAEFTSGNIDPGDGEDIAAVDAAAVASDRGEIVVAPGGEQRVFSERARRDQADDVAAHHGLAAAGEPL